MSAEAHLGALFLNVFFSMLFQMLFLRLRTLFWRFRASILATLGGFFGVFSYLGGFLKIALPCRRELKNQGRGGTDIAQKRIKNNKIHITLIFGSILAPFWLHFGSILGSEGGPWKVPDFKSFL